MLDVKWVKISVSILLLILLGYGANYLCIQYPDQRYQEGYNAAVENMEAKYTAAQAKYTQQVLEKERQAQAVFDEEKRKLEEEKENAQKTIHSMRTELNRLRTTTDAKIRSLTQNNRKAPSSTITPDANEAARGWILFQQCTERYARLAESSDRQRDAIAEWQAYGRSVEKQFYQEKSGAKE